MKMGGHGQIRDVFWRSSCYTWTPLKTVITQQSKHVCVLSRFSHVQLCVTLWTIVRQAPLSTGFSRQEYWNGLPFTSPGDLPNPGIEPASLLRLPSLAGGFFTLGTSMGIRKGQHWMREGEKAVNYSGMVLILGNRWQGAFCTVHGIIQARIQEWVAFPFSRGSSQPRD